MPGIPCVPCRTNNNNIGAPTSFNNINDHEIQRRVEKLADQKVKDQLDTLCKQRQREDLFSMYQRGEKVNERGSHLFTKSISSYAKGLARVSKTDLMSEFDFGVPPNADSEGIDALILYNKHDSLPSNENIAKAVRYEDPTKPLPFLPAKTATENCDTMNVVLMANPGNTRQCFALVGGQYQSYHIQRWMRRRPDNKGKLDPSMPLKLTSKGYTANGKQEFVPPKEKHVKEHQTN